LSLTDDNEVGRDVLQTALRKRKDVRPLQCFAKIFKIAK